MLFNLIYEDSVCFEPVQAIQPISVVEYSGSVSFGAVSSNSRGAVQTGLRTMHLVDQNNYLFFMHFQHAINNYFMHNYAFCFQALRDIKIDTQAPIISLVYHIMTVVACVRLSLP